MSGRKEQATKLYEEGRYYLRQKKFEQSVRIFQESMQAFWEVGDLYMYVRAINSLGVTYGITGNETMAVDCYLTGLDAAEKYHIKGVAHLFYNNIGTRYQELGDEESALKYFLLALEDITSYEIREEERAWMVVTYLNIGVTYWDLVRYEEAEKYLILARDYAKKYGVDDYDFPIEVLIAHLYLNMGNEAYAREHLDELMQYATSETFNLADYAQDIMEMVDLLVAMKEYDKWLTVIRQLESVSEKQENVHLSLQVIEMYMHYYDVTMDEQKYTQACIKHAEMYQKVRRVNNQEKILALNVKIALHQSEREAEEAKQKSERDALTGLLNRYALQKIANKYVEEAKQKKTRLLVGISDIDCFKQYNDTYGHLQGDEILKHVANTLYDAVDGYGEVFRFGGDEFLMLIPNADAITAERVAKKIGEKIAADALENRNSYVAPTLTLSHGYYLAEPKGDHGIEYYIDKADTVLYEVKKHGRNRYQVKEA